jgi:hypothetical protein
MHSLASEARKWMGSSPVDTVTNRTFAIVILFSGDAEFSLSEATCSTQSREPKII